MFKKSKYLLIAAGLVCALIFPTFSAAKESTGNAGKGSAKFTIVESKYKSTDVKLLKVESLLNRDAQKNINKTLRKEAAAFAREYQSPGFTSAVTPLVAYNKNNLFSVVLCEYYYLERAAHPMTFQKSFVFDLATGERYELSQIFEKYSNYQDILNNIIKKAIKQREIPMLEPFENIDEQQEFYLKDDALVIYYQRYRYSPYAYGFLEFEIPYDEIKDILAREFKILADV